MKQWKEKIIRYAVRNRKSPEENRRRVGKSLSLLAVILFAVFLVNFAVIIGTGSKFGKDLVQEAKKTAKSMTANKLRLFPTLRRFSSGDLRLRTA